MSQGLEEAIDSMGATANRIADELVDCRHRLRSATEAIRTLNPLQQTVALMLSGGVDYDGAVRTFKRFYIVKVLDRNRGNQTKAAQEMGMHRNSLRRVMADLNISLREGHETEGAA
jgi:DNA-binding NtrC family response regulator